jgi:hypothetical protein
MGLAGRHNRCHRPRATSDTIDPDAAKSEAFFHHALAAARQQQPKSWELRVTMSLARLWRGQGKVQQARELLAPVFLWRPLRDGKFIFKYFLLRKAVRPDTRTSRFAAENAVTISRSQETMR